MEIWIAITIGAAFLQNIRSSFQKHLKGRIGTTGATFVRFGFGLPVAATYAVLVAWLWGYEFPRLTGHFALWVCIAAMAQIGAQACLVALFAWRNFTVGTAYSRTEPVFAALFALIFVGEILPLIGLVAVIITVVGVVLISVARPKEGERISPRTLITSLGTKPTLIGLASGTLFGVSASGYRVASTSLDTPHFFVAAVTTLLLAISVQTLVMLAYMALREPDQIGKIARVWKPAALVGLVGATATFGWFSAFTLQQAALVKVVAQVEMIFTYATSILIFRERINRLEVVGVSLIVLGICVLVLT
ncbi:MAG: EamA family transporter [Pseudomonadota bacterium]